MEPVGTPVLKQVLNYTCFYLYVSKSFFWLKNILGMSNIKLHSFIFYVFCNAVLGALVERYLYQQF